MKESIRETPLMIIIKLSVTKGAPLTDHLHEETIVVHLANVTKKIRKTVTSNRLWNICRG